MGLHSHRYSFYSWRRYCNKHKIRLGGYAMDLVEEMEERESAPMMENEPGPSEQRPADHDGPGLPTGYGPGAITAAYQAVAADASRARSPTPPRALYRSTTGKGVAFTDEDVIFLVRFLEFRSRQHDGKLDMVSFWKDVATKVCKNSTCCSTPD